MKRIEITKVFTEGNSICYEIREERGLGLLQHEVVDLFIRHHDDKHFKYNFDELPMSILLLPISLYLLPITYFYKVELVIPEMDKELYNRLPTIYEAYSKIYGPFKQEWMGKVNVGKIVENSPIEKTKYDQVVFYSGGVDACHAGINYPGKKSLLVSIPDIEYKAKNDGPLREEKFTLIKSFSNVVNSDWLLISNNFNASLFRDKEINQYLQTEIGLCSSAYLFDGWAGIKYLANMCCVTPVAYLWGIKSLIMGSAFEQIENRLQYNEDGASPELSDSLGFAGITFAEQEGLMIRRTKKVKNIIDWCKNHNDKTKIWVCFNDDSTQCGFCSKCIRTQLNILCAGENPKNWGFANFSEKGLTTYVKEYRYREFGLCWLWDNVETIEDGKIYPFCNDLLHWLKKIGYKKYHMRAEKRVKWEILTQRLLSFRRYPHYVKVLFLKVVKNK